MQSAPDCRVALLAATMLMGTACFSDPPASDDEDSNAGTSGGSTTALATSGAASSTTDLGTTGSTLDGTSGSTATGETTAASSSGGSSTTTGTSTGAEPFCGNGVIDGDDICDLDDLDGITCGSFGFGAGELACNGDCRFDFMDCQPPAGMVFVPPGPFMMGSEDHPDEQPIRNVLLAPYFIDMYEVSAAEYQACMDAVACQAPMSTENMQFDTECNVGQEGREDHPANCVGFDAAEAYCAWAEKRLPTEAEWEKAARGTNGIRYPWGDGPAPTSPCVHAHHGLGDPGCGLESTQVRGSYPAGASPYDAQDMAGNVWEWVSDYYAATYDGAALRNPTGPAGGTQRVLRGGGWYQDTASEFTTSRRHSTELDLSDAFIGFRCVLPAPMPRPM